MEMSSLLCLHCVFSHSKESDISKSLARNLSFPFQFPTDLQTLALEHTKPYKPITVNLLCLKINRQNNFVFQSQSEIAVLKIWNQAEHSKSEQRIVQSLMSGRKLAIIPVVSRSIWMRWR